MRELTFDLDHTGDVVVARIDGEIDSSNVAEIGRRLRETLTNQSMALVVDLAFTSYLDSAGINLLFALGAELRKRQQRLHLCVPAASPIARMLAITGIESAMTVHDTRDAAVAAASRGA